MSTYTDRRGLSLLELIISLALLAMIVGGLAGVIQSAALTADSTRGREALFQQASLAMERMVGAVQGTLTVIQPGSTNALETLQVSECSQDQYDNATHIYLPGGDGILDADNDRDFFVNEGDAGDSTNDIVTFTLDKSQPADWKLMEQRSNYATAALGDLAAPTLLCEHVTAFTTRLLSGGVVEISLTLSDSRDEAILMTRARSFW